MARFVKRSVFDTMIVTKKHVHFVRVQSVSVMPWTWVPCGRCGEAGFLHFIGKEQSCVVQPEELKSEAKNKMKSNSVASALTE